MGLGKDLKALYEAHMKQVRDRNARDAYVYDEGVAAGELKGELRGKAESIIQILEELGEISSEMKEKILTQQDVEVLNGWLKLAVKAQTVEEFF